MTKNNMPLGPEDDVQWVSLGNSQHLVLTIDSHGVVIIDKSQHPHARSISWAELQAQGWGYSSDRKTWANCEKDADESKETPEKSWSKRMGICEEKTMPPVDYVCGWHDGRETINLWDDTK